MKKLFILTILSIVFLFQSCGQKEKREETKRTNDSIAPETLIIDTITTIDPEVIVEDLKKENEKTQI